MCHKKFMQKLHNPLSIVHKFMHHIMLNGFLTSF